MLIEEKIKRRMGEELGEVGEFVEVLGGDINRAARVVVEGKRYFVKWCEQKIPGMFVAEAAGLRALRRVGVLVVPEVVLVDEEFLVLEWLEMNHEARIMKHESGKRLGKQLARLHRQTGEKFGFPTDNFIGMLPQRNDEMESWVDFWWECRLLRQLEIAENRIMNHESRIMNLRKKLLKLKQKLPELVPEKPEASLLHGDLWGGNWSVLESGPPSRGFGEASEPVVYDPAVYFGHREVDLAMTRLFGGFGEGFYMAYENEWRLDRGWEERVEIYQLYPLLVHWNLFGGGYGERVEGIVNKFVVK